MIKDIQALIGPNFFLVTHMTNLVKTASKMYLHKSNAILNKFDLHNFNS